MELSDLQAKQGGGAAARRTDVARGFSGWARFELGGGRGDAGQVPHAKLKLLGGRKQQEQQGGFGALPQAQGIACRLRGPSTPPHTIVSGSVLALPSSFTPSVNHGPLYRCGEGAL